MQFSLKVQLQKPLLVSFLLAELIIVTTLTTIPQIFQSLYWQTGMLTYVAPLIIATIYVGIIGYSVRRKTQKSMSISILILGSILAFIAGGFSETYAALQTGGLFLAVGIGIMRSTSDFKRHAFPLVVSGFLGSLIAMCIMILSPGNAIRASFFPTHPDLFSLVKLSTTKAFLNMCYYNLHHVTDIAIALVLPAVLAITIHPPEPNQATPPTPNSYRALVNSLLLPPIVGFILIMSCFAPSVWGMNSQPPERAIVIPQFILICMAVYWAYHAGMAVRQINFLTIKISASQSLVLTSIFTIALLVFGPAMSIKRNLTLIPTYKEYATLWDSRDAELRSARLQGKNVITVGGLETEKLTELEDIGRDPCHWVNRVAAGYYRLDSLTTSQPP